MSDALHKAVNALIDPTRMRLLREDGEAEWQTISSLYDQLNSNTDRTGGYGATQFGSRPVIRTGIVALLLDITHHTTKQAVALVGTTRGNPPANIRAIAANLTDAELIGAWTDRLTGWAAQARTELRLDPPNSRSARGAKCPACGETTAHIRQDDQHLRTPALAIVWTRPAGDDYHADTDWRVGSVECRCCKQTWARGETLNVLIEQMMAANLARETLAEGA